MPAITQLTRFKSNNSEEMVKAAKKAKAIFEKHGAEFFRLSRFHVGSFTGEWLAVSRYSSWSAYGKAQEELAKDEQYQKVLAHVLSVAEMTARNITVGIDL
jgi:hypothetical protein